MDTTKRKAAGDVRPQAACNDSSGSHHNAIATRVKALIVRLALWGILPVKFADWIIRWGGLRNA